MCVCVCERERTHLCERKYSHDNSYYHYNSVRYRRNGYMIIIYACMCVCGGACVNVVVYVICFMVV